MPPRSKQTIVLLSPFLIILINFIVAIIAGKLLANWAFLPIILIEWCFFLFCIFKYGGKMAISKWLKKPSGSLVWILPTLVIGLVPLPLFLLHHETLSSWEIWLPWILLALINPFIEEFYWRGLLSDYSVKWPAWISVLFTSSLFALNHAAFGINSKLNSGPAVIISTFIMGVVWAITYKKTNSLRWIIFAHFLVDFLNLSVPSFLDLYDSAW